MSYLIKHKKKILSTLLFAFLFGLIIFNANDISAAPDTVDAGIVAVDNSSKAKDFGCFASGGDETSRIAGCTAALAYYLLFKPAFWIMSWMSIFFNFVLFELVVGMGHLVNTYMSSVMIAWGVLRDLANVFLVFLTIYVGIATILGISGYGYKQLLWRILLAALFVNFSSTFTKLIIDVSNMAAIQTYAMFIDSAQAQNPDTSLTTDCLDRGTSNVSDLNKNNPCLNGGIAGALWSAMKITSTFNITTMMENNSNTKGKDLQWNMAFTAVMASVLFIVMAFLFAGAGFMLIGRFVMLILMLIISPIALVAWLTKTSGAGRKWWHTLLNQAMFAPMLLLMWWVAYVILQQYMEQITSDAFSTAGTATSISGIATATVFIIIMGFFVAGLILAKNMGAYGANAIMKTGSKWARGAAIGVTGGALAYSAGLASAGATRAYRRRMAEAQETNPDGTYKRKSVYHRGMQKLAGTKVDRAMNAALSAGANKRFMGTKSLAERNAHSIRATQKRREELRKEGSELAIDNAVNTLNSPDERLAKRMGAETEASVKARQIIAKANIDDIEAARARNKKGFRTDAVKSSLTREQAMRLSNKTFNPKEKIAFKETAYKNEISALQGRVPESEAAKDGTDEEKIGKIVRNMRVSDIKENIPAFTGNLNENIKHISQKTYNELLENKDGKLSDIDIKQIKTARENHLKTLSGDKLARELGEMDYQTMASLDKDFLSRPDVVEHLDTRTLNEMIKKGLTKEKRDAIESVVKSKYKKIQHKDSGGQILDKTGKAANPKQDMSGTERNIASLYKWFDGENNSTRPLI